MGNIVAAQRHMVVVLACLATAGCGFGNGVPVTTSSTEWGLKSLEISSGELLAPFDPGADRFEVASLNTTGKVSIRMTAPEGTTATLGGTPLVSGQWAALPLNRLDKKLALPLDVSDTNGHSRSYAVATLPGDFPDYSVQASHPKPGTICYSANSTDGHSPSYLFMTDEAGHPIFYKKLPDQGFNFQQHHAPDGSQRYSYFQKEGTQLAGIAGGQGKVRLLDGNFNELKQISLLATASHGALATDLHDYYYIDDDHYIMMAIDGRRVANIPALPSASTNVAAAVIQEVKDGQVLFDWASSDYPEFYANSTDQNDFSDTAQPYADYMHLNSIDVDPSDNNLIVSFRHQDQVVKLDRKSGQIIWRLGGLDSDFALTETQKFSHQHFARMDTTGSLTLFDNGNYAQKSRMLTFQVDQAAKTVKGFKSFEPEARYSGAMGSFQQLDASTSYVGWGYRVTGGADASEFTQDGVQTFGLTFANPTYASYRSLKYLN